MNIFYELLHLQPGEPTIDELLSDYEIYNKTGTSPMIEESKRTLNDVMIERRRKLNEPRK